MQCWRAIFRVEKESVIKNLGLRYMMKEIIEAYMKRKEIIYGN